MPFCSRRTWKTPSGFTTWPTPRCYDDGVVLPRFQSHTHTGKTTGVYHDNHPDTAPDAGLRVPLLTRHHPGCCPTFIPAFTARVVAAMAFWYFICLNWRIGPRTLTNLYSSRTPACRP